MAAVLNSPGNGRESSPRTPETNFRELDEAFLQTQARVWLGAILDKRFDEGINISDLLADGQILYELYQVIQKSLETRNGASTKVVEREMISARDITEKYPYPKVDCFLRICQTLGLEDIDLFTSSDVVQKRNTRGVCLCLRSLSKKARAKKLNVPDFDFVTYTINSPVSMPTDMVGNRRRNLERSTSPACSSSQDTSRDYSRGKHWQGDLLESSPENSSNCKSEDDNSEVVESAITTPTSILSDDASSPITELELNPEKYEHLQVEDRSSSSTHHNLDNDYYKLEKIPAVASVGDNFVQMDNGHDNIASSRPLTYTPVEVEESSMSNESCLMEGKGNQKEEDDYAFTATSEVHNNAKARNSESNGEADNHGPSENVKASGDQFNSDDPSSCPKEIESDVTCSGAGQGSSDDIQCVKNTNDQDDETKRVSNESMPAKSSTRTNKMRNLVVKGTGTAAVVGLVLLFLQLRRNLKGKKQDQNNTTETNTNRNNANAENRSSRVRERSQQVDSVYPPDRLKLR